MNNLKNEIRNTYKQKRKQMSTREVKQKSTAAANLFLQSDIYKNAKQLMLYMPLGNETDTSLIKRCAFDDGKKLIFPVTDGKSGIITPVYATSETEFIKGSFSVNEPKNCNIADVAQIDVIVVPGIAFDKTGARIGFGKGCYDMFLKNATSVKVGYCYDWQICHKLASEMHDAKMDYIVSNRGIIKTTI